MPVPRPATIRRLALLAVLLPTAVAIAQQALNVDDALIMVLRSRICTWAAISGLMMVVGLEGVCALSLVLLVRARGNAELVCAWLADPQARTRRRHYTLRITAAGVAILAALVTAEIAFRMLDIRPPEIPPIQYADAERVDNHRNAIGLREAWSTIGKDDNRLRIAMLGDSITYGEGVQPEETFSRLVAALLATDWPEGVVTINMGEPGTAPDRQLQKYLAVREQIRPDIVVHVLYPNDLGIELKDLLYRLYRVRDSDLLVGDWSYVLRYVERRIRHEIAWKYTVDYFHGGERSAKRSAAWQRLETDVRACRDAAVDGGAIYCLVQFPWIARLDDYLLDDVHGRSRRMATDMGVPYCDLLPSFAGRDALALRITPANEHPNAAGHRIAAIGVAEFLRREVLPLINR